MGMAGRELDVAASGQLVNDGQGLPEGQRMGR